MVRRVAAALIVSLALPGFVVVPTAARSQDRAGPKPPGGQPPAGGAATATVGGPVATPAAGLALQSLDIAAERDKPEACFTFNQPLARRQGGADPVAARVEVEEVAADARAGDKAAAKPATQPQTQTPAPARTAPHALVVRDATICVEGLDHGGHYRITLKAGLPAADGVTTLAASLVRDVTVSDRAPSLAFRGAGYILPRIGADGLPLRTINVARAGLRVLRINDPALVEQVYSGRVNQTLNERDVGSLVEKNSTLVWRGEMAVGDRRNQAVTTPFPIDAVLGQLKPGVYVAVAEAAAEKAPLVAAPWDSHPKTPAATGWEGRATQWFIVSDIGLTTFTASNGLFVHVHSLQGAQPLGGVELRVVGRNNQELARATTAADGTAHIDAAALQGKAQALFATTRDGDYSLLDLTAPGMALTGRGGGGRAVSGPVDAYVYADRGIYRPGETVRVTALLRDLSAAAVSGRPLTVKVQRPDGLEVDRQTLVDRGLGGYSTHVDLPGNAYPGVWTITAHADPDGPAVGRLRFSVADFVPPRIDLDLGADRARIGGDGALTLTVNGRTPVGTPAANLAGSLTALVRPAADPFPAFRDYHFGPADAAAAPVTETLPGFTTDANGAATLSLSLKDKLGGGQPLEAVIRASLFDVGGGANDHELVLPVDRLPYAIGIRPRFADDAVPEGAIAGFDVVAVAPDGRPLDKAGLSYELYEERFDYVWFEANGAWDYKSQVHDVKLTGGGLAVTAKAPGGVEVPVSAGRYRLEVTDPATGIVSAVRFSAGAWVSARLGATPDKVEISVKDGPAQPQSQSQPGKAASVFIRPPYRSTVLINVADGAIRHSLVQEIGPEGAVVEVPMDADLTGGAYVLATAFAPADNGRRTASRRAIGAAWVPAPMAAHTLVAHIDGPAEIRSRQQVRIPVAVSGAAPGQSVYMTFSAVDETVLDLTDFKSPDPAAWFYGQRALGVEVRDVYGRLTPPRTADGSDDPARRPSGADHPDAKRLLGLPPRGAPVVAQYSGILTVAADGRVSVPLSIPDFQGRLRLMATVWSAGAVGHGERSLAVHDPVLATVTLPRFLAPGDKAAVTVAVDNAAGPRGAYTVTLQADGPLELPGAGPVKAKKAAPAHGGTADKAARGGKEEKIPAALREAVVTFPHLGKGERATAVRTLTAAASGAGRLVMTLKGPDGITLVRDFTLPVRTALPHVIRHDTAEVRPGQTVALTSETAQGLRPGTVAAGLAVSALPELDVPGLLLSLEAEGAGSAEAIVSDTLPLLYYGDALRELGRLSGTAAAQAAVPAPAPVPAPAAGAAGQPSAAGDALLRQRVDRAIDKILSLERADGGFGLWSPDTPADPWLTAYVLDFLTRARQAGYGVADAPYRKGLDWLAHTVGNNWVEPAELPGRAYALLVGAQTRALDASAVRFFFQTYFDKLPTVAARAQVAAALAAVGANDQAQDAFNRLGTTRTALPGLRDFGSPLRDQALVLALMADNGVAIDRLAATARQVQGLGADPALISGQERAWLLLAAKGLSQRAAPMTLGFAGQAPSATGFVVRHVDPAARPLALLNGGQQAVQRTLAVSGIPVPGSTADKGKADDAHHGVTVERRYYDLKGHPVDPARIRQGDLLAVVVSGKTEASAAGVPDSAAPLLVVDPLPAGLGIETVGLGRGALPADLAAAVGDVSDAAHVEARDDRYVAAVDLPAGQSAFKLVYLVRATVPGSYLLPPVQVRDMTTTARGGEGQAGALTVLPAGGAAP